MSDKPSKDEKQLTRKMTPERLEEMLQMDFYGLSKQSFSKSLIKLFDQYFDKDPKVRKEVEPKLNKELRRAYGFHNLDRHYFLVDTLGEKYGPFLVEFTNQIIQEYDCKTATEKSLAQLIAGSFTKVMQYSQVLNGITEVEFLSHEKNGYYSLLSKEIDRSHRQYISALMTLKQLKSPPLSIKVNARAAFMANNQQINVDKAKDEKNNKPK